MAALTPATLPPLQGRYRIETRLGTSRLAVVYRAHDDRLQRPVLVHLLRRELADQPALVQRFRQEAQYSAARTHRSLLDVYDTGELAGRPFLVTEYVTGRSLRELGALSLEDALLYFRQIVGAVAVCQASGVPHPPISSTNVILVDDGHVELLESWQANPEDAGRDLACYRPPERASGAPLASTGAVYSLGLLLIEMITGKRLVDGNEPRSVAQAHLSLAIPSIAELRPSMYAPALDTLIQHATARDPQRRLPDAAALAQALDHVWQQMAGDTVRIPIAQAPSVREQVRRSTGRLLRPVAPYTPLPRAVRAAVDAADTADALDPAPIRGLENGNRALIGLVIMGALFLMVICAGYQFGSLALEQLAGLRLPRIQLNVGPLDRMLPEWLTGVVEGSGELLVVTIRDTEGLNMREDPGLSSAVITLLPNGTQVRRLDGPRVVDGVPWLQVRARISGREVTGWISANYVKSL